MVDDYFELFLEDYFAGIPECWLIVPEGNGKTTDFGGLAVYCLEFRTNPAVNWAASSRDQAGLGYAQAAGFVKRSPRLSAMFKCQAGFRRIRRNDDELQRIQIFAADENTGDGVVPTDSLVDELHRHRSLGLYLTWAGKGSKRDGQIATISTAGEPYSEFETQREKIRQTTPVIERRPGFIHCRSELIALHEYAVPEDADVTNMATVKLANPSPRITEASLAAKYASPTMTLPHWRRMTCNLPTRSNRSAITEVDWHAARTDEQIPDGTHVWLGLDVGWVWDTTAAVPLWWRDREHRLLGPASILVPPRDGSMLEADAVKRAIQLIHDRTPIETVVMDMSRANDLAQWIEAELGVVVVDRGQGNVPAVEDYDLFMEALRSGWLKHSGDLGLTRHALNAIAHVLPRGDARFDRPSQTRQGGDQEARVIDALTAASMVNAVAATQPAAAEEPIFAWA